MPKLLILSSNPRKDLNLNREVSDLIKAVKRLEKFDVHPVLEVRSQELQELLTEHNPHLVHFCGHGAGERGLVFQNEQGQERLVSTEVLVRLFKVFEDEINCVVLNACDSDHQAVRIAAYINYVIGMSQPILDRAAYIFAVGFYRGLAAGKSIEQAHELGCVAIQLWSEENAQSAPPQPQRKAECVEPAAPTQPALLEHLKPILRRKQSLEPVSAVLEFEVSALNLPPKFEEDVRKEIERKDYKDQARAAYDNFGQFSAENAANLTKSEYAQRQILVNKVKQFWIEGFLQPSLQGIDAIKLDLKSRPDAIADSSQTVEALSVDLDKSFEQLHNTRTYEEIGQGRTLLILGNPGAGKTIALMQLAQRLLERSEQNLSLPMPVVFNLSSWTKNRKSIVEWVVDELREKYQVPKALSEPWIAQQQLILLLDGLDEVDEDYCDDCVRALNNFIGLFPQTEMAICSRVQDYEALTERLQISSALCLQPLSPQQVYQFLDRVGGALTGVKELLKSNTDLERFAQTPLILTFMSVAYQGWSVDKLMQELSSTSDRKQHLFDAYIERRLNRGITPKYSKNQILNWLSWLASQMQREKQTVFLIEKIQPTWLQNRRKERIYGIRNFVIVGTTVCLIVLLTYVPISSLILSSFGLDSILILGIGFNAVLINGLSAGLTIGFFSVLIDFPQEILPLERISWSWKRVKQRLVNELFVGFVYGLAGGVSFGLIRWWLQIVAYGLSFDLHSDLTLGVRNGFSDVGWSAALLGALIFGLFSGLESCEIEQRSLPNQGIYSSRRNCFIIGFLVTPLAALIAGLIFRIIIFNLNNHVLNRSPRIPYATLMLVRLPLTLAEEIIYTSIATGVVGLSFGLIIGLRYGGLACIQHVNLRQMLYQKGFIPWNYAEFLDFASNRLLMKKVGGGYLFFHRMLMEHFAKIKPN